MHNTIPKQKISPGEVPRLYLATKTRSSDLTNPSSNHSHRVEGQFQPCVPGGHSRGGHFWRSNDAVGGGGGGGGVAML